MSATQEQLDSIYRLLCSGEKANINIVEMLVMGLHLNLDELLRNWGFDRLGFHCLKDFLLGENVSHKLTDFDLLWSEEKKPILAPLQKLNKLLSIECRFKTGKNIFDLPALENLKHLDFSFFKGNDLSWVSKFPNLETLNLSHATMVLKLESLGSLKKIKNLDLSNTILSSFSTLGDLKTLEVLRLNNVDVFNIKPLYKLPKLTILNLRDVYSDSEEEEHRRNLPNCNINYF